MKKLFSLTLALTLVLVSVLALATVALAASMSGAIWTTDGSGNPVDQNIYEYREDVYLNGGPKGGQTQGLPDGDYFVKVTAPNGELLGYSVTPAPVQVADGHFEGRQLWSLVLKASDDSQGYDPTPNNGGEYKVWISQDPAFPNSASKTDNFKVRYSEEPPPEPSIDLEKYVGTGCNCPNYWTEPGGPYVTVDHNVWFEFVVTNTGPCELTNIQLVDPDYPDASNSPAIPASLAPGASFTVEIGPYDAVAGEQINTATVTAECDGVPCDDSDSATYYGEDGGC
jgi:hypothetical protein